MDILIVHLFRLVKLFEWLLTHYYQIMLSLLKLSLSEYAQKLRY